MSTTVTGSKRHLNINADEFAGDLNGTVNTATTATTQSTSDNSTKVATTAFVKAQGYITTQSDTQDLSISGRAISLTNGGSVTVPAPTYSSVTGKPTTFAPTIGTTSTTALAGNTSIPSISGLASTSYVDTAVANLIDSAPANLNTLNELAEALNDDDDAIVTINTALGTKLPLAGGTLTGDLTIDKTTPRLDFMSNQSGTNVGGRLELNENGNFWLNAQGGRDLWLNWYSPNSPSSNADLAVGDGNSGSAVLFVDGSARKVGILKTNPSQALDVTGNILSSGTITGTTLTGTSLDINGNADISGTLDVHSTLRAHNGQFYIEDSNSDTIHLQLVSNSTEGTLIINNGSNWGLIARGVTNSPRLGAYHNGTLDIYGFGTSNGADHADDDLLARFDFANEQFTVNGEIEATSLDINGNADISGNLSGVDTLTCTDLTIGSDATTAIGKAYLKTPNVSAVSYQRINANETLSLLNAAQMLSAIGGQPAGSYLTSDTNYLKSNASDSFSGILTGTNGGENLKIGGIRGTAKGSQTGEYIHLYERVHVGGPSGWGASSHGAPSQGLSTWGSVDFGMNGSGVIQLDGTTVLTAARALTNIGTIGSGAITSTGKIQGTELEGTSLDINGNADISGTITSANGNFHTTATHFQLNTPSGYIQMGAMNTSHAHMYTDRADFYFNKAISINGDNVLTSIPSNYFKDDDIVMNENPFGGRSLYNSQSNNPWFLAADRYTVTQTGGSSIANAFNGDYESSYLVAANTTATFNIDFGQHPGYPYGWIYLSFYYTHQPATISGRVYNNYAPHTVGWSALTFTDVVNTSTTRIVKARQSKYGLTDLEITLTSPAATTTRLTACEIHLDRPGTQEMPVLNKFRAETLYKNLTVNAAITATGKIQGAELEGTSLDINGSADISGNLQTHGNSLLGSATGDYVHVNDKLYVGATDSGDSEFWFGEGTTGDVNYGTKWRWDSGYTQSWYTVNNSTETLMMSFMTNDTSQLKWFRMFDMNNKKITELATPTAGTDAATKAYVDGAVIANTDTQDLSISGQTLSLTNGGSVTLPDTNTVYTHPTFNGDDFSVDTGALTGAVVVSDIDINVTTDTNGHVTDANGSVSTRTLTLANLGYTGATNANNFTYTHPTTAGNKHVPTGGAAGQFLKYSSSGTAVWATPSYIANTDTVYTHPTNLAGDDIDIDTGALTGATVISDLDFNITTNTAGHVTDANATVATRNLTLANLGYSAPTTVSGSSGSCTGNAATATKISSITNSNIVQLSTTTTQTGNKTFSGNLYLNSDSTQLQFGAGNDMQLFHNGANGEINNVTGNFTIDAAGDIILDADSNDVIIKDAGADRLTFNFTNSGHFYNVLSTADKTWGVKGTDGSTAITALAIDMANAGKATFNNDVVAFSDRKLKENIQTLDGKKVLEMRGVSFTRKDTKQQSSGVIAQEIQKVAPELVSESQGTLGVSYGNLVGYLIEAVKDQQKQIDELKELCNGCSK